MTREETKELLPILQAFAEGKTVLTRVPTNSEVAPFEWVETQDIHWYKEPSCYRIKPEPKYRPFKDAEECWNEMQKHQPFGWLMCKGQRCLIVRVTGKQGVFCENGNENLTLTGYLNDGYTFADGEPFGVKEEEVEQG